MKRILALDGNNLLHRAFYALPIMETPSGLYTNAIYGFMGMLIRLLNDYAPDYIAVAFDLHGPTFRHERFAEYKAGRRETPVELRPQFDALKGLLEKLGVAMLSAESYEADDLLGTVGRIAGEKGIEAYLVTGDRDAFQLIDRNTSVLYTHRGVTDVDLLTPEALKEKFGYPPERVTDMKALMGDSSDNIPGIPGIGPKTALKLIESFESLEDVLARPEEVLKGAALKKVQEGAQSARLSKELATIHRDAPITDDFETMRTPDLRTEAAYAALAELDMNSLIERLRRGAPGPAAETVAAVSRTSRGALTLLETEDAARDWLKALKQPAALTLFPHIELADDTSHARLCVRKDLLDQGMEPDRAYELLGEYLADTPVYLHDAKTAHKELLKYGVTPPPALGDAFIMGYLLLQKGDLSMRTLCTEIFGAEGEGGAADLYDLCAAMEIRLAREGMDALYREIELPLTEVLMDMERQGFNLDSDALRALGAQYDDEMARLQAEIYELAHEEFNILSPKQLGVILFEKMCLPPSKKTKSGYSTDADVLEGLDHPIADKVLEYRALSKLKGTYVDGLLAARDSTGRVHTTLHQTSTATGRISSAEPNLQNIPIRTELGRAIRGVFTSGGEGRVLVDADYSQIELRVLAHMSGDENMIEAFKLGQDIHTRTASEIFGVPMDQVTPSMRSSAKAVNFGVVYGISGFGLARNTGITQTEAREFISMYFSRYPGVRKFMDACVEKAREQGYVSTLMGRRRYLPELKSRNYTQRAFGERAAMNAPIQGTAADIIKLAMVRVWRALREQNLNARLILQVHDELIVEAPAYEADLVKALLVREMEGAATLAVPLVADAGIGRTWGEAK